MDTDDAGKIAPLADTELIAPLSPKMRLIAGCLFPIMMVQGMWVRTRVPKLPEAKGPREGIAGIGMPLRILVAGDSSAAGVGASTQTEALVGRLVSILSEDYKVHWKLIANTGWTTAALCQYLTSTPSTPYDVALTAIGLNDITSRNPMHASLLKQVKLVDLLRNRFAVRHILISGLPPLHRFPSLPEPLRWYIGSRAKRVDFAIQGWSRDQPDCDHIQLNFPVGPEYMASDGFHPGPGIYALWGKAAAELIRSRWR
jgi:lysophospholipase L1-like esterase